MKKNLLIILLALLAFNGRSQAVKIMSYNIRYDAASDGDNKWEIRKNKLVALIRYHEPDFMGTQEGLKHQLDYMNEQLPAYAFIGAARDDGKEKGEYSAIFYKKNDYTLLQQHTFWLSPTPEVPAKAWDAALPRICTYGLFKHKTSGKKMWVMNTHFDHRGETARAESAKQLVKKIAELKKELNVPVILTGDFNANPTDAPIQTLDAELTNARTVSKEPAYGGPETFNGFKFKEQPKGIIDHIYLDKISKYEVRKFITITDSYQMKYPSDHLPVMAHIVFKK